MNEGKEGASYVYPDSFVQLLGYMRAYFHLPYRQTEGVVRAHAKSKVPSTCVSGFNIYGYQISISC